MTLRTRVDPVERVTTASVRADLALPEQKRALGEFAARNIDAAKHQNQKILGRIPPNQTWVDGRLGATLESVNPFGGQIITEFELLTELLRWIAATLVERSPHVSGDYRRGHTLFVDGREVPVNDQIPVGEEYAFTNPVPYSRKIEIGKTKSGRDFVVQVPNRIYERTAQDAKRRFGNIAEIFFTYRGIVGGMQVNPLKAGAVGLASVARDDKGRFVKGSGKRLWGGEHNAASVRFPTIYVRQRKG